MDESPAKHSNDLMVFGSQGDESFRLEQFHINTLASSDVEIKCFPSEVKKADMWFPALRGPRGKKKKMEHLKIRKQDNLK